MNIKQLTKAKLMKPFRRFQIHLTSGKDLLIEREQQLAVSEKDRMVFVFGEDAYHLLAATEIASITFLR